MKDEAKDLAKQWGFWLLMGLMTMDDRHNRNLGDTISLVLFGILTLVIAGATLRFLYRLVTGAATRRRAEAGPTI
ncbi:hypothetical protein [Streptomyces sp. NPDC093111]|uniref:hypothetical protein n=1 Tax=Streptomyces sp. NPDC093111 TaxID=3154978 RepID=UPI0034396F15